MGLGYLPLPIHMVVAFTSSVLLMFIAHRRWNFDRKGLIVFYLTIALGALLSGVARFLNNYLVIDQRFNKLIDIPIYFVIVILIELLFLSVTHKGNSRSKKIILLGWGFIIVPIIVLIVMYFLLSD